MRHLLRLYSKLRIKNGRKGEREGGGGPLAKCERVGAAKLPPLFSFAGLSLSFIHSCFFSLSLSLSLT